MKKQIVTAILFFLLAKGLSFSQDLVVKDIDQSELKLADLKFEEVKYTDEKYLLKKINLPIGSVWNKSVRAKLEKRLLSMRDIIEEVVIEEKIIENQVYVTIFVEEKIPFIIVPFIKYTNSNGIIPKLIFRYYNLGGRRKYLNFKFDYYPMKNILGKLIFKDPALFNLNNLKLNLETEMSSTVTSYYLVSKPTFAGVLGNPEEQRWNNELNLIYKFKVNMPYTTLIRENIIDPYFNMEYKKIFSASSKEFDYYTLKTSEHFGKTPIDEFNPKLGVKFTFPVKFGIDLKTTFEQEYKIIKDSSHSYVEEKIGYTYGNYEHINQPNARFALNIPIPFIDFDVEPFFKLTYKNNLFQYICNDEYVTMKHHDNSLISNFGINFEKSFSLRKSKHKFKLEIHFEQYFFKMTGYPNHYYQFNTVYDTFKVKNEFTYDFKYTLFKGKEHQFNMKWLLFVYYNDKKSYNGDYQIGKKPSKFEGWAGVLANFSYYLPLFEFSTPAFLSKKIKRTLNWKLFWDFYVDVGLSQNNEETDMTIDFNHLHLNPALAVGTALRLVPSFMPVYAKLSFGIDVYKIVKARAFDGAIAIEFTIPDNF